MGQSQFGFAQQLKSLWRHKWTIILVALVAGVTVFIITFMRSPMYEATARIMGGSGQQRLAAIPSGIAGGLEMTYLQDVGSQIEVMRSHTVLEKAVTKVNPAIVSDPDRLQLEVNKLEANLSIDQVGSTNLMTLSVLSIDPDLAQQQADAVAEAYVEYVQTTTMVSIERALQDTTEQLEELQQTSIDLSINPELPRLIVQMNTALDAVREVSEKLQQIEAVPDAVIPEDAGTVLTASQLNMIRQRILANSSETTEISVLTQELNLVSDENNFTNRSSDIAVIESRIRALTTKLNSISIDVSTAYRVETDLETKDYLGTIEEQLEVASATGTAILGQITSLYDIQEQYITARLLEEGEQQEAMAIEADANMIYRVIKHTSVLTSAMDYASEQVREINARITTIGPELWRFTLLRAKADSIAITLQEILKNFDSNSTEDDILITRAKLSEIEIQTQKISISLASISSEVTTALSGELDSQITTELLHIQELISIANNSTQGLEEQIAEFSAAGGDVNYTVLDDLRQELQLALLSGDTSGTMIVDMAVTSAADDIFSRYRGVLLAALAGLLLASVGVLTYQYFDRTVHNALQIEDRMGITYLASIDMIKGINPQVLSVFNDAIHKYLESFRLLRTNLNLESAQGKILLISSPQNGEGKTAVAVNLSRVLALQKKKVLLIDGNLHNPDVEKIFGLNEGEGLSEFLSSRNKELDCLVEAEGIDILRGGQPSAISSELLSSPRLKSLLEKAKKDYNVIIIDSPSILERTDTRILAKNVDGVILVLQHNFSKIDLASESKKALEASGAIFEGFVLNKVISSSK